MASICSDPNGFKRVMFVGLDGKRKTLRIGKRKGREADAFKQKLESLLSAKQMQSSPDRETSVWVSQLSDDLHAKLAMYGLVDSRTAAASEALVRFVDAFIANRESDTKPSTRTVYKRTRKHLFDFFGVRKTLAEVTTSNAIDFRRYLIGQGMADNTVRRTCGIARQFFADAVERELVTKRTRFRRSRSRWLSVEMRRSFNSSAGKSRTKSSMLVRTRRRGWSSLWLVLEGCGRRLRL